MKEEDGNDVKRGRRWWKFGGKKRRKEWTRLGRQEDEGEDMEEDFTLPREAVRKGEIVM